MTPFLRAAMARAEAEREARMASTPATALPVEGRRLPPPDRCLRPGCQRAGTRRGMCPTHYTKAYKEGRRDAPLPKTTRTRCECGGPAEVYLKASGDRVCPECAAAWSRYVNAESTLGAALRLARERGAVSAVNLIEEFGVSQDYAHQVVTRLAKAGRLRRVGKSRPVEYEVANG